MKEGILLQRWEIERKYRGLIAHRELACPTTQRWSTGTLSVVSRESDTKDAVRQYEVSIRNNNYTCGHYWRASRSW